MEEMREGRTATEKRNSKLFFLRNHSYYSRPRLIDYMTTKLSPQNSFKFSYFKIALFYIFHSFDADVLGQVRKYVLKILTNALHKISPTNEYVLSMNYLTK